MQIDHKTVGLKRKLSLSLAARIAGGLANLGFVAILGHLLGLAGTGLFLIGFAIVTLTSAIARLGIEQIAVRELTPHFSKNNTNEIISVSTLLVNQITITATIASLLLFIFANEISFYIFNKQGLIPILGWFSITIFPLSLSGIYASFLQSAKRAEQSVAIISLWPPLISAILLLGMLALDLKVDAIVAAQVYALSCFATLYIGARQWFVIIGHNYNNSKTIQISNLNYIRSGFPLLVTNLSHVLLLWSNIILIGIWSTPEDAGAFGIAHRIGLAISGFLLPPLEAVISPRLAELQSSGNTLGMQLISQQVTTGLAVIIIPIWLFIVIFNDIILRLFGSGFESASTALIILATGQLFNVASGSTRPLLIMNRKEVLVRNSMMVATIANIFMGFILIPSIGAIGAAISFSLAIAGERITEYFFIKKQIGISIIPTRTSILNLKNNLRTKH